METSTVRDAPLRERLAEELRALLARRRISGSQLARRIGRSQSYVSRRLTGEIAFDMDDLERISRTLEIDAVDLLGGRADSPGGARQLAVRLYRAAERMTAPDRRLIPLIPRQRAGDDMVVSPAPKR